MGKDKQILYNLPVRLNTAQGNLVTSRFAYLLTYQ